MYNSNNEPGTIGFTKKEQARFGQTNKKRKVKDAVMIIIADSQPLDLYLFLFLGNPLDPNLEEPLYLCYFKSLHEELLRDLKYNKSYIYYWSYVYAKKSYD